MIFLDSLLKVRLRKEFKEEIETVAAKLKMTVAELVRTAIRAFIDKKGK